MTIYNRRKIQADMIETDELNVCGTQAAINSDGCLTIRSVYDDETNDDTIVVLTRDETDAVLKLFRLFRERDLPF